MKIEILTELENIILLGFRRKKRGLFNMRFQKMSTLSRCRVKGNSELDQKFWMLLGEWGPNNKLLMWEYG